MTEMKLLPCPFCGSEPELGSFGRAVTVHCPNENCDVGAETAADTERAAFEQWNRRAPLLSAGQATSKD